MRQKRSGPSGCPCSSLQPGNSITSLRRRPANLLDSGNQELLLTLIECESAENKSTNIIFYYSIRRKRQWGSSARYYRIRGKRQERFRNCKKHTITTRVYLCRRLLASIGKVTSRDVRSRGVFGRFLQAASMKPVVNYS